MEDNKIKLEEMSSFFNNRVDGYERHMMDYVDGADKYYIQTANLIPTITGLKLLDLGCGTGLELDEILKINPTVKVTGVDMGECVFDGALSVQTLHHFSHEEKIKLYKNIFKSLKENGFYIETDYMAPNQEYEDFHFSENKRIRFELGITEGFYHYDTPCTVENQTQMLYKAGFISVEKVWQHDNTIILFARK